MELYLVRIISYGSAFVGGSYTFWLLYQMICGSLQISTERTGVGEKMLGGAAACICLHHYGYGRPEELLTAYVFFCILGVVAILDWENMQIPNLCVMMIFVLAAVSVFTMPRLALRDRALGMVSVSVPMLFISMVTAGSFGGGDVKLMAASGLVLGWQLTIVSAVLAVLLGGGYAVWLLIQRRAGRRSCFAFGPFLCAGMACGFLYGNALWAWYTA